MLDRPNMQRVRGTARVTLGRGGLIDLAQAGSGKAMLPRVDGDVPEVVFLNTSGGVTSGDRLEYALTVGRGARVTGTTQTAERGYRAPDGPGRIATQVTVGAGAHLDWLPQEVIAFDGAHLDRVTQVDLAPDATFLGVDSIVLGREAHGETVRHAYLSDRRSIRLGGTLLHDEHIDIGPAALRDPATLGGARAMATLVMIGQGAADALDPLRAILPRDGCRAEASAWDGRLVVRFLSPAPAPLRRALACAIVHLRGVPMPRVWQTETPATVTPTGKAPA